MAEKKDKEQIQYKVIISVALVVMVSVLISLSNILYRDYQNNLRVKKLKDDIAGLGNDNSYMQELLDYVKTESYKEKKAKESLELKKPGEIVVVIPEQADERMLLGQEPEQKANYVDTLNNQQKWLYYFFGA